MLHHQFIILGRSNSATHALHNFISAGMMASAPYVRENGVSPIDLLGVVQYAHKTLGRGVQKTEEPKKPL